MTGTTDIKNIEVVDAGKYVYSMPIRPHLHRFFECNVWRQIFGLLNANIFWKVSMKMKYGKQLGRRKLIWNVEEYNDCANLAIKGAFAKVTKFKPGRYRFDDIAKEAVHLMLRLLVQNVFLNHRDDGAHWQFSFPKRAEPFDRLIVNVLASIKRDVPDDVSPEVMHKVEKLFNFSASKVLDDLFRYLSIAPSKWEHLAEHVLRYLWRNSDDLLEYCVMMSGMKTIPPYGFSNVKDIGDHVHKWMVNTAVYYTDMSMRLLRNV